MTHREILSALSGMLLAMFVAFLSSTVVSNALPTIITDLRGSQSQYTWVITATLLASTASTPIWGKLADLFSKKLLIQLSIVIFIVGSMLAGSRPVGGDPDRLAGAAGPRASAACRRSCRSRWPR